MEITSDGAKSKRSKYELESLKEAEVSLANYNQGIDQHNDEVMDKTLKVLRERAKVISFAEKYNWDIAECCI